MARTVSIGRQDFEKLRINNNFYVDKTHFIRQWWEAEDDVTPITRPRRFGKTLNMSMLEPFFSVKYAGRGDLFEGLSGMTVSPLEAEQISIIPGPLLIFLTTEKWAPTGPTAVPTDL